MEENNYQKIRTNRAGKFQRGFTIVETLVALGLFAIVAVGIYLAYANILDAIVSNRLQKAATAIANEEIELVRNLSYENVGIVGGAPSGVLVAKKTVPYGSLLFTLETFVRNIDDPFDGTLGGAPNDTAPGDYRLVTFRVTCPGCTRFLLPKIEVSTIAAPKGLENSTNNGNLFIHAFDANGLPVANANVHIENTALVPTITIDDETNNAGILQLVDIPTSTTAYQITVSKNGYSTAQTYASGAFAPSAPTKLHATVAEQQITDISFGIDRLAELTVGTADQFCQTVSDVGFHVEGEKLVAIEPDVKKYSKNLLTQTNGSVVAALEWDSYAITPNDAQYYFSGFTPQRSIFTLDPGASFSFNAIVDPRESAGLLVTVQDTAGASIQGASVALTKTGFDTTLITGRRLFTDTNWAPAEYTAQDGGIEVNNPVGELRLIDQGGGTYSTTTESWLISKTFNFGTSTFYTLRWQPAPQPPETGTDSLRFQIATNSGDNTWNFIGPDGTANTFYTVSDTPIAAVHNGDQYLQYKVFMKTVSETATPSLEDVTIEFSSACTPAGQVFFNGLSSGSYNLSVSKTGYETATSSISVAADQWQESTISLLNQ
jgi:prepilin-type N-terminal cleavage/methylation domain-containing protein